MVILSWIWLVTSLSRTFTIRVLPILKANAYKERSKEASRMCDLTIFDKSDFDKLSKSLKKIMNSKMKELNDAEIFEERIVVVIEDMKNSLTDAILYGSKGRAQKNSSLGSFFSLYRTRSSAALGPKLKRNHREKSHWR